MFFKIKLALVILFLIGTAYSFVKEGFKKGILRLIFNVGLALILLFDYGTLWYKFGYIIIIILFIIQFFVWYKKDETSEQ
jgi:uncharacterized membrane protein YedE/YeeE